MNPTKLLLMPEKARLLAGSKQEMHVLAKVQVEKVDRVKPTPINLAIVIDRSGSMQGEKLEEAKKCAISIVRTLREIDSVCVVAFDSSVDVVSPIQKGSDRFFVEAKINALEVYGSTNLHGGWLAGVEQLVQVHQEGHFSRVLLLSDGQANKGERNLDAIASQCQKMAKAGISTSTYGVGEDFSETFLSVMAEAGAGNAYYGELASDLEEMFMEEFSLLQCMYGEHVVLDVKAGEGCSVKLLNNYSACGHSGYRLPNMASGAEVWAVLAIKSHREIPVGGCIDLVEVEVSYSRIETGEKICLQQRMSLTAIAAEQFESLVSNEEVKSRVQELFVANLYQQAREHAKRGEWEALEILIEQNQHLAIDHAWLNSQITEIKNLARRRNRERFSKESYYSINKLNQRLKSSDETVCYYSTAVEEELPMFLRRKVAQGKNLKH